MKRCFLLLLALPTLALAEGGLPTQPYIYVEGKATVEESADMVTLKFLLGARDLDQGKANKQVQAQAGRIFQLLKAANVSEKDILASDLNSEAEFGESDASTQKRGKLLDYRVARPFMVKIRDVASFPGIINGLLAAKVDQFSGVEEGMVDSTKIEEKVWESAIANARERAEKTLKAVGMKIDSVFAISPVAFPEIHAAIFGSAESGARMLTVAETKAKSDLAEYHLAPVSISQNVHVIYLISPVK